MGVCTCGFGNCQLAETEGLKMQVGNRTGPKQTLKLQLSLVR